jgi:cyclopropane-fatty-acyl-phospholipid synthase
LTRYREFDAHQELVGDSQTVDPPATLAQLLLHAGVQINGPGPADMQVHDARVYADIFARWSLGLGETYMDGLWDCAQLDAFFDKVLGANLDRKVVGSARMRIAVEAFRHRFLNLQSARRAFQVGEQHYDIGNDVFEAMLDSRMIYSCAYWAQADTLEAAQEAKLDLICRKLELAPGMTLLDIGCGWGGLARFAAERYGVNVVGITVSREQQALARERCKDLPVQIELQDYRDLQGTFDRIASVGMFEHVGPKNYATYFDSVCRLLKPDGIFLLHTIGIETTSPHTDPWIDRYIFPNGKLPSASELSQALEGRLIIDDWHNFGQDYDRTLMAWWACFEAAWPRLRERYDERFYRMWKYYLHSCAGFFRCRQGQLWQLVLTPRERRSVYRSVR